MNGLTIFNLISITAIDAIAILVARKLVPNSSMYCVYVAVVWGLTVSTLVLRALS